MKKIILLLLTAFGFQFAFAQSGDIFSANTSLTNFLQYGEKEELVKAKESIDKAMATLKEKGMLDTPDKLTAKAYLAKGKVYAALPNLDDRPELTEGALNASCKAYFTTLKMDAKGKYKKEVNEALGFLSPALYSEAHNDYKAENYESALNKFDQVLMINDHLIKASGGDVTPDTLAVYAAALSAHQGGKLDRAKELYQRLMDMKYPNASVFFSLSKIYREEGDDAKANEILESGRKMFPDSKALVIEEVNYLLGQNKHAEAIVKMEEAIKLDPKNESLYFALGSAYDKKGDYEPAIANYKKALELNDAYFDAYYNLGAIYYNQAVEKIKQANAITGFSKAEQAQYKELENEAIELFKKGLPHFDKAYGINAKDASTLIALKEIHANIGDLDKSKEYKTLLDALK